MSKAKLSKIKIILDAIQTASELQLAELAVNLQYKKLSFRDLKEMSVILGVKLSETLNK